MNKAQKLVQMVQLMARVGGIRASELEERFELDARSLRRYLADLKEIGVPVEDDGRGDDRVVSVDPRWRRTGVQLTLTELLSLHFGRTLFNFLEGTSFAADIEGAIERLEPAVSRAHQDVVRQLDTRFLAVREHTKDYRGDGSDRIDEAITALVYNNPLRGSYRKANGSTSEYVLHPYTLATYKQGLYLFALDVEVGQVKTYALERFTELKRSRERFEYPVGWNPHAHLAHAFGIISGPPEEVCVAFSAAVAGYLRERTWHPSQGFSLMPDGRTRLRMRVADTVELRQWILSFGRDAEVLSPAGLVAHVAGTLRAAAAQYGS